jgi:hypothetical protein
MRLALAAVGLACAAPAGAQDANVEQVNWRYDEDWSKAGNDSSDPWWRPAKHIPLSEGVYLSAGLEARVRYEGFGDNLWGDAPAPDDSYMWLRLMPHIDAHAGPVRGFVQFIAGYAVGVQPAEGPVDETGVDLLQGFADLRLGRDDAGVTLRGGRELIALGSERLVGLRYGPNIPQAFDGFRAIMSAGELRVDALAVRPTRVGRENFDDATSDTERLSGVYAVIPIGWADRGGLDAYWLSFRAREASFEAGRGRETRRTIGARVHGARGAWAWNWEFMLQRGRFAGGPIRAWSIASETVRSWPGLRFAPTFTLRANIVSGDKDSRDGRLQTFNPMFPKGKYFGELSPIGPYNLINLHPSIELQIGGFAVGAAVAAYWRETRGDGVYDLAGALVRGSGASNAHFVGTQAEVSISREIGPDLSWSMSIARFDAGEFLKRTGPSADIDFVGLEARWRF